MFGIWDKTCECWVRLKGLDCVLPNWVDEPAASAVLLWDTETDARRVVINFLSVPSGYEIRAYTDG